METTVVLELLSAEIHLQRLVKSVDDAPFEILSLSNDVANLNLIISSLKRHGLDQDQKILLVGILKSNELQIKSLGLLAEEMNKAYGGGNFRSKRRKWIRHRANVATVIQDMRFLRISIGAAISTVFLSIIQSSELKLDRIISSEFESIEPRIPTAADSKGSTEHVEWDLYQPTHVGLADLTATVKQDVPYLGLVFSICQTAPCLARCNCLCHAWEAGNPTPFLNGVMGALLAAHCKSPLRYTKCSIPTCRRSSPTRDQVVYFFPPKIIPRMISIVQALSSSGNPMMGLMPSRVVAQSSEEIVLTIKGDIRGLQNLISERKIDLRTIVSAWGDTPLSIAVSHGNAEMAGFLLHQGLDPLLEDACGIKPSDIVWTKVLGKTIDSQSAQRFAVLFADSFDADEMGFTVLHKIVLDLSFRDLRTELQAMSTPIDAQDNMGTTPLNWAALRGDIQKLKTFLEFGADPNVTCHDGLSPLHNAVTYLGSIDCTLALLNAEANVAAQNARGYSALHFAAGFHAPKEYIQQLLARGVDINHRSKEGGTALRVCVGRNQVLVKYMLDAGADPEIGTFQDEAATPLVQAVRYNRHVALRILLEYGVNYEIVGRRGETIVHLAAEWADEETLDILSEAGLYGLNIEARNVEGLTAEMVFERRVVISEEARERFERFVESVAGVDDVESDGEKDGEKEEEGEEVFVDALDNLQLEE